ncbi:MAG: hypothetical protein LBF34_04480, partial [Puniceicoccales bacterium]|nr:hypothetical protein [Puniceicoccales bacterium]
MALGRRIEIGNGDYATFKPFLGNRGEGEIEGVLHLSNGKKYTIKMNVKHRENPMAQTDKLFAPTSKKKAMQRLANRATLSPSEARKAFQGLAKFFKSNTHVGAKNEAVAKMLNSSILEDAANTRLAASCGPDRLAEVYRQRNQGIFSMDNAQHYGNIVKTIFEKALHDSNNKVSEDSISGKIQELQLAIDSILHRQPQGEFSKEEFLDRVKAMKKAVIDQLDQLAGKKGEGAKLFEKYY